MPGLATPDIGNVCGPDLEGAPSNMTAYVRHRHVRDVARQVAA